MRTSEYEKSNKLKAGAVYLWNYLEETVLMFTPEYRVFVRFPGEDPYEVYSSTKMAVNAFLAWEEITKHEYERF